MTDGIPPSPECSVGSVETVVVLVTGSGQARGADTMLRRLVLRFLMVAGFTAAGWLAGVLLTAGTASADPVSVPRVPGVGIAGASGDQHKSGHGDLVGGLLGGVTSTLDSTLTSVTTTVSTVTTTVTNTVTATVDTVNQTVEHLDKAVSSVVEQVAQVPSKVLEPLPAGDSDTGGDTGGGSGGGHGGDSLLPKPVTDLLSPHPKTSSPAKEAERAPAAALAPPAASAAPAAALAAGPTAVAPAEHPRQLQEPRRAAKQAVTPPPARSSASTHMAGPGDRSPGPLPGPQSPVSPAAPAPSAAASGTGGSDARSVLAVLVPQTQLAAPRAGLPLGDETFAEVSRSAGLPATPPD